MPPGIHTKSRARKKTCPGSLGQLDLFAGQVTIKNDLPQSSHPQTINNYNEKEVARGNKNMRVACPKDKMKFKFFSEP